MSPEFVAAIKIAINVVMMTLASIRFYIMYFKQRRRSAYDTISHVLLYGAIMVDNCACGTNVWVLMREIQAINKFGYADNKLVVEETNLKILFAAHFFYYLALCVIKLAYLFFYAQLFKHVLGNIRYIMHAAAAIWVQCYVVGFVVMFAWCMPFSDNMETPLNNPHCPMIFSLPAFEILAAANIFSDLAIACVPIILISSMRLSKIDKRGLIFVFCVGSISIIASVARLVVMTIRLQAHRQDWDSLHVLMLWCHSEILFGVLAFMLPAFRFLITKALERYYPSRRPSQDENAQIPATFGHASPQFMRPAIIPLDLTLDEKKDQAEIDIQERNGSVSSAGGQSEFSDISRESESPHSHGPRTHVPVDYV